jgi:hypothetical protein
MPARKAAAPPGVYDMRYNDEVVAFMGRGYSLTAFAGEIGVSRSTLDHWVADHPTFARAVERGQARRARVLEDRLLAASDRTAFGLHMEALKTAAPDDWRGAGRPGKAPRTASPAPTVEAVELPDNGRG